MTTPPDEPGDRRPRLDRAPGERYAPPSEADSATALDAALRPVAGLLAAVIAFVVLGGIVTVTFGLVVLSVVVGWVIGLLVSPPPRAALVGLATVALGFLAIWGYGRIEGGVLDPITYLLEVEGPVVVVLSLLGGGGLAAAASR